MFFRVLAHITMTSFAEVVRQSVLRYTKNQRCFKLPSFCGSGYAIFCTCDIPTHRNSRRTIQNWTALLILGRESFNGWYFATQHRLWNQYGCQPRGHRSTVQRSQWGILWKVMKHLGDKPFSEENSVRVQEVSNAIPSWSDESTKRIFA